METYRAPATETAPSTIHGHGAAPRPGSRGVDRDSVRLTERPAVADAPEGNGLRVREHLLASIGPLATRRRVAPTPCGVVGRIAPARAARFSPRPGRQRLYPRAARGKKTGPNPTDRRKA